MLVRVIVEETDVERVVATVYITSKIRQIYGRGRSMRVTYDQAIRHVNHHPP